MNKLMFAVLIAVLGVVVWLALKTKYKARDVGRRFLSSWRRDPRFRETALFGSALIMSLVIFAILPGL